MAGQFAKPRSSDDEIRERRDAPGVPRRRRQRLRVHAEARQPDPARLLKAYHTSASTLNLIRAFTQGGFADLRQVHEWNRGFVTNAAERALRGAGRRDRPGHAFMARLRRRLRRPQGGRLLLLPRGPAARLRAGADPDRLADRPAVRRLRRTSSGSASGPASSTARTSTSPRAIHNPIGVKLGPTTSPDDALALIDRLDPDRDAGPAHLHHPDGRRHRPRRAAGAGAEGDRERARRSPGSVIPCTATRSSRRAATRPAASTTSSTRSRGFFEVHHALGTVPGGLHIELTGDDVTECLGGAERHRRRGPGHALRVGLRPAAQPPAVLELAFLVAEMLGSHS